MRPATFTSRARFTFTLTTFLLFGLAAPVWPDDLPASRATLRGIAAIGVAVEALDAERDGITRDQLRTDVELRLRKAGIKVVSSGAEAALILMVDAFTPPETSLYSYVIRLELRQLVALLRDPGVYSFAVTWSVAYTGLVGAKRLRNPGVRGGVADMVDKFINAYLEQNPRQ